MHNAPSHSSVPSLRADLIGGLTTFLTMAYIVVVNPAILSTEGTGLPFAGVMTATILLAASMSILMGLYAKLPFGVAPGMGLNAFLTFSVILGRQIPWPVAMGLVFWAGVMFLLLSVLPVRMAIVGAIPAHLRAAAAMGIGLFLAFIGLKNAGLVVADPVTFVKFGAWTTSSTLAAFGLFVMAVFLQKGWPIAFLLGIFVVSGLAALLGLVAIPEQLVSTPDFSSTLFQLDILGALRVEYLAVIFAIMMTDLFDSISTLSGVSQAAGLVDEKGEPKNLKRGLLVDACATFMAGILGTSAGTAYIESAAGIEAGGKTGRAAVVTGLLFLPCLFFAPLAGAVPGYATAPVLILVGAMMMKGAAQVFKSNRYEDLIPSFLALVLIPLTFSITQGLLWGLISHVLLYASAGRYRELSIATWVMAALSALLLWLH
ncbi:MAG: NCS2 family permease [Pseudobdellovibrionaceae bacterium]|nr:NCS2 family permease [Pseudobdellovibrionaceae bacterium]